LTAEEKRKKVIELKKKINKTQEAYDIAKAMQLALKLVINGTYGAFAHPKFVLSNSHIANAITAMGRDVINYMLDKIEKYFYEEWHLDKESHKKLGIEYVGLKNGKFFLLDREGNNLHYPHSTFQELINKLNIFDFKKIDKIEINGYEIEYSRELFKFDDIQQISKNEPIIIYGDTDSTDKNTIIPTDKGEKTIEDFYNENIRMGSAGITLKGHESVKTDDKILNYDNDGLYYAPVKRIIRHKVSKSKWKLKIKSGKEIIITNDHSMIVFRDGIKLEVKPSKILKTDKILSVRKK